MLSLKPGTNREKFPSSQISGQATPCQMACISADLVFTEVNHKENVEFTTDLDRNRAQSYLVHLKWDGLHKNTERCNRVQLQEGHTHIGDIEPNLHKCYNRTQLPVYLP